MFFLWNVITFFHFNIQITSFKTTLAVTETNPVVLNYLHSMHETECSSMQQQKHPISIRHYFKLAQSNSCHYNLCPDHQFLHSLHEIHNVNHNREVTHACPYVSFPVLCWNIVWKDYTKSYKANLILVPIWSTETPPYIKLKFLSLYKSA